MFPPAAFSAASSILLHLRPRTPPIALSLSTQPSCSSIALSTPSSSLFAFSFARSFSLLSAHTSAFALSRSFRPRISRAWRFTLNAGPFPSAVSREHARVLAVWERRPRGGGGEKRLLSFSRGFRYVEGENRPKIRRCEEATSFRTCIRACKREPPPEKEDPLRQTSAAASLDLVSVS